MLQNFIHFALLVGIFIPSSFTTELTERADDIPEGVERVIGRNGKTDIIYPPSSQPGPERTKLKDPIHLWKKEGVLFLYSALEFNAKERCMLKKAIAMIANYSCIPVRGFQISKRCGKRKDALHCVFEYPANLDDVDAYEDMIAAGVSDDIRKSEDYIKIGKGNGCAAGIGRYGGKQPLSLDTNCFYHDGGTVMHELIHCLGYAHEHQRFDRDHYVRILFSNILSNRRDQFFHLNSSWFEDFGPYTYGSLMHYSEIAMSRDWKHLDTIRPHFPIGPLPLGQTTHLLINDMIKIRSVTSCAGRTYQEHQNILLNTGKASFAEYQNGKPLKIWNECKHLLGAP